MTSSNKKNPKLWESIKNKLKKKHKNKWSARLSQQLVKKYKKRGGLFTGPKPNKRTNSLVKWTKEDWGYLGKNKKSRYLPKKIRSIVKKNKSLTRYENRLKSDRLGKKIKYSKKLKNIMKKNRIF